MQVTVQPGKDGLPRCAVQRNGLKVEKLGSGPATVVPAPSSAGAAVAERPLPPVHSAVPDARSTTTVTITQMLSSGRELTHSTK